MPGELTQGPNVVGLVVGHIVVARGVGREHVRVERSEVVLLVHHPFEGASEYTSSTG
jgi:hypothetical protein